MTNQNTFDIFISYNRADEIWVENLKTILVSKGFKVWFDKDEIAPGRLFAEEIEKGLDNSSCVLIVISPEAIKSGWVKEEYYRALSLTKRRGAPVRLIPVLIKTAELPGFLSNRNWIDFRDQDKFEKGVLELIWGITGIKDAGDQPTENIIWAFSRYGKTSLLDSLQNTLLRVAQSSVSIVISGETGTGKEEIARTIHQMSKRSDGPFITVNCATASPWLLETELFGYEKGTFTGAEKTKVGLIELANGGILFLDEIDVMDLNLQSRMLRFLTEGGFRKLGGVTIIPADTQVIASTNKSLPELVKLGQFKSDFYYRLRVVEIEVPPLREWKNDIPVLVDHFIQQVNPIIGTRVKGISKDALDVLVKYEWPGNIRELRNVVERALLFCDENDIQKDHLPPELLK